MFVKNRDFLYTSFHLTPLLGGGDPSQNIAIPYGVEKLEWWCYPTVKKFGDIFCRFDRIP